MSIGYETVTLAKANKWIAASRKAVAQDAAAANRPLNHTKVDYFVEEMLAGNWRATNQGIQLGKGGRIIDGQHRVSAVSKSGVSCKMLVCRDDSLLSARDVPVDMQGTQRAMHWILGRQRNTMEVALLVCQISVSGSHTIATRRPRSDVHRSVNDYIVSAFPALTDRTAKSLSQTPIRSSAIIAMQAAPDRAEYIADQYARMVSWDEGKNRHVERFVMAAVNPGSTGKQLRRIDALTRSYVAFTTDPSKKSTRRNASAVQLDVFREMSQYASEIMDAALPGGWSKP